MTLIKKTQKNSMNEGNTYLVVKGRREKDEEIEAAEAWEWGKQLDEEMKRKEEEPMNNLRDKVRGLKIGSAIHSIHSKRVDWIEAPFIAASVCSCWEIHTDNERKEEFLFFPPTNKKPYKPDQIKSDRFGRKIVEC